MTALRAVLAPLLVALAVLAVYGPPADRAEFVQDDAPAFLQHPAVKWPVDLSQIVRAPYFGDADHAYIRLSRPLATLSFAVEKGLGADSSRARHWTDLLLYALACAWLTALIARLAALWRLDLAGRLAALAGGLWFALHPAHAEVVMQVAYRPELLALLFELVAFEVLLAWRQGRGTPLNLAVGTLAFGAALWSKEQPLMLLPLAFVWALARPRLFRRFLPLLVAWTVIGVAWLAWRHWLFGPIAALPISEADNPLAGVPTAMRIWTALAIILRAAQHLVWPVDLAPDYAFNAWPPLLQPDAEVWGGLALLLGLLAAAIFLGRRARQKPLADEQDLAPGELGLLALVWAMLTWLPVANLLFVSTTLYADRLLFAPSVALCAGVPLALALWQPRGRIALRSRQTVAATLAVVTLGVCLQETPTTAAAWTNALALYARGVVLQPNSMRMANNLAFTLMERGRLVEARHFQQQALRIRPTDLDVLALGFDLARKEGRCEDGTPLARTLAQLPKPAVLARRIALDWAMRCRAWTDGWAAVRLLPPGQLRGREPLDVFALGVAAGENAAVEAWASPLEKSPWQVPAWTSAGVFGADSGGRPLEALRHLADLQKAQPQLAGLDKAARDLYERHRDHADAPAMRALLQATWKMTE